MNSHVFPRARTGHGPSFSALLLLLPALPSAWAGDPCGTWQSTPAAGQAGSEIVGVDGLAANLAYAVGRGLNGSPFVLPLLWRFDGTQWVEEANKPPYVGPFGAGAPLRDVAVVAANDVWTIGSQVVADSQSNAQKARVSRFQGNTWLDQPSYQLVPGQPSDFSELLDVAAIGGQVWFVGGAVQSGVCTSFGPLALRWDGNQMQYIQVPCNGAPANPSGYTFNAVAGVAVDDLWAVGGGFVTVAGGLVPNPGFIQHWNGATWTYVPHQAPGQSGRLTSVQALASDHVWALGEYNDNGTKGSYLTRWDGSTWTSMVAPSGTRGFLVQNQNAIHAVGDAIHFYDGQSWSLVEDFTAELAPGRFLRLSSIAEVGPCELMAVGKTVNASGFSALPFAARFVPKLAGVSQLPGCQGGVLAGNLTAATSPVLGADLVLNQDDALDFGGLVPGQSVSLVALSLAGASGLPCGTLFPGIGPGGLTGEVLIDLNLVVFSDVLGAGPWAGPTTPNVQRFPLPLLPGLAGLNLYAQGLWVTPGFAGFDVRVTNGLELTLGF